MNARPNLQTFNIPSPENIELAYISESLTIAFREAIDNHKKTLSAAQSKDQRLSLKIKRAPQSGRIGPSFASVLFGTDLADIPAIPRELQNIKTLTCFLEQNKGFKEFQKHMGNYNYAVEAITIKPSKKISKIKASNAITRMSVAFSTIAAIAITLSSKFTFAGTGLGVTVGLGGLEIAQRGALKGETSQYASVELKFTPKT